MCGYVDDCSIPDDAFLWRRIPQQHFVLDANLGRQRPSSAAFEDHPNGTPMSVMLAAEVIRTERGPEDVLAGHEGFALAEFRAGLARSLNQGVARDPVPEEPAHAVVFGKKSGSVRKTLAKESEWVIAPPGEDC